MAFIPLGETSNAGLVMSGYGKPYLKRASYAKGYNPEHLKAYQAAILQLAQDREAQEAGFA